MYLLCHLLSHLKDKIHLGLFLLVGLFGKRKVPAHYGHTSFQHMATHMLNQNASEQGGQEPAGRATELTEAGLKDFLRQESLA